jgi:hypothetical protein
MMQSGVTFSTELATAIVGYIVTNAEVSTTVNVGGLQNVSGHPTDAPSTPVTLTGTLS